MRTRMQTALYKAIQNEDVGRVQTLVSQGGVASSEAMDMVMYLDNEDVFKVLECHFVRDERNHG